MRTSVTSLLSYDKCPRLYAFYKEGWAEHEEQWPGMLQGSVVHDVVNSIAKGVRDEHIDGLIETVCWDVFKTDNSVKRYGPGVRRALGKFPLSWDEVRGWDSEIEIEGVFDNHTLNGRVDLIRREDGVITLVDIKTSKVDEIEHLLWNSQNRYYALILDQMYPDHSIFYEYWCLPTDAKEPSPSKGSFWMKPEHIAETRAEVVRLFGEIESRENHKDFPRMNMSNCKFCMFRRLCMTKMVVGKYVEG
mgnify:CR=1 FL=1|tara:strand:- start:559 stop:1299 length:741 start_codon:yes stop_codon:yes gene_type:complete